MLLLRCLLAAAAGACVAAAGASRELVSLRGKDGMPLVGQEAFDRVEELLSSDWTPVNVNLRRNPPTVALCQLNHALRHEEPSTVPMFQEWSRRSGCKGVGVVSVPLSVFEGVMTKVLKRYDVQGRPDAGYPDPRPKGIIYHMMRTGSTLWGNMLARAENVLVYSEPFTLIDAVSGSGLAPDRKVEVLRLLFAGMTRVKGHDAAVLKFPIAASVAVYRGMHAAFPNTPWVYIYRRPEEVLASMFKVAGQNPNLRGGAPPRPPCTRTKGASAPSAVRSMLQEYGHSPQESGDHEYCAAFLAMLCDSALTWSDMADASGEGGPAHPKAWFINYVTLPDIIVPVSRQLFGLELTETAWGRVAEEGQVYSKSRAKPGKGGVEFEGDAEVKMKKSPDTFHMWSAAFLYDKYATLTQLAKSVPVLTPEQTAALEAEQVWVAEAKTEWGGKTGVLL